MTKRQLKLSFPTELITEPVVYNLSREFRLVASIQRAGIVENKGVVVLDLEGGDDDIERGITSMTDKGIEVEPMEVKVS
jgi:hypothetical protein